jgi:hypothetical protein
MLDPVLFLRGAYMGGFDSAKGMVGAISGG